MALEAEGIRQTHTGESDEGRNRSHVTVSQGKPRYQKPEEARTDSPLETPEPVWPCGTH